MVEYNKLNVNSSKLQIERLKKAANSNGSAILRIGLKNVTAPRP